MEKISRMAVEVNKLIGSSLLSGSSVYIPQAGSLSVAQNEQGVKSVVLINAEQGESLIEIIRQRASCTEEQASEIFRRWREEVSSETLAIRGVGEVGASGFVIDARFAARLNPVAAAAAAKPAAAVVAAKSVESAKKSAPAPKKSEPMKSKEKKGRKGLIIIIILLLVALVGYFAFNHISKANAEKAQIEALAQQKAAEQRRVADSIVLAQEEAKRQAEAEAAAVVAMPPRYRFVYGVYDLRSNVDVAIALINKRYGAATAKEYPFGARTMVSIVESDDRSVCQKFLMENYDIYPDGWVYDSQQ